MDKLIYVRIAEGEKEMNIANQIVLECAFRYALGRKSYVTDALGRKSYVTDAVSSVIIDCWDDIPKGKKIMIASEIEDALLR